MYKYEDLVTPVHEIHSEHVLNEVVMSLYEASKVCPKGMLVVGYNPQETCERCEVVEDSFIVYFKLQLLFNGRYTNYINLCDCCLNIVIECEREFQEKNEIEFSTHSIE